MDLNRRERLNPAIRCREVLHRFGVDAAAFIDGVLPVVQDAARIQHEHYARGVDVITKADHTPVTLADQQSEAVILAGLAALAPTIPVIAEEAMAAGRRPPASDVFFLVDPLDGTREFLRGTGEFTVNIALIDGTVPVFGLIYAPVTKHLFVTTGNGAALRGTMEIAPVVTALEQLSLTPLSARPVPSQNAIAMTSRSHLNRETEAILDRLKVTERRAAGSSLKFCLIAAGEADIYARVGPTCEWDTAAGQAILTAAGGSVTMLDGSPFPYGKANDDYRNPGYIAWGRRD